MILRLLGYEVSHVQCSRGKGKNHLATLAYKDGRMATLHLLAEGAGLFHLSAIGARGRIDQSIASL